MKRQALEERPDWRKRVVAKGMLYYADGNVPYWRDDAIYTFTAAQIDEIEAATNAIQDMYLKAVEHVLTNGRLRELGIPERMIPLILKSWDEEHPAIYDRFDLCYDGKHPPKLLENNADTPTSLLEAAVIQWFAIKDRFGEDADQFNSLHERLVAKWAELKDGRHLKQGPPGLLGGTETAPVYFAFDGTLLEDRMTILYLMETAMQAKLKTVELGMSDIGWHAGKKCFVDLKEEPIRNIFKLYPWEYLAEDAFAAHLEESQNDMFWMEPAWNMVLSCKGLLAILWELFPNHPNLLPAYLGHPHGLGQYAKKPFYSREGQGITLVRDGASARNPVGEPNFVYQALCELPSFEGHHPVIGSWLIDGVAAGMGIRESDGLITDNMAHFVPHLIT
ncbi:glutathionylspermidine synthase family protein [Patescibacteria group bacterium]|nr:glutathionylspermidine synthase family protein [Patescibacteria group bacterium]